MPQTAIVIPARWDLLSWDPFLSASIAWTMHDKTLAAVEKGVTKGLTSVIVRDRVRKKAYYECITSGLSIVNQADQVGEDVGTAQIVSALFAVKDVNDCRLAVSAVDDALRTAPGPADEATMRLSAIIDDAAFQLKQPAISTRLDDAFRSAKMAKLRHLARLFARR